MHLAVYLALALPLIAIPAARPVADRLDPRHATWLLTATGLLLAAGSTAALGALTLLGFARLPFVGLLGGWSAAVVRRDLPTSWLITGTASLLLGAVIVTVATAGGRRARGLVAAYGEARRLGRGPVVVLADPAPDAFAVPGFPGRVVVSTGMLDALDATERQILLAHERAHLRHRHHLFLAASRLAAAAHPALRPLDAAVAYTVERWADEVAARAAGDRRRTARAIGKAALVRGRHERAVPVLGFGDSTGRRRTGPVPRRVAALLAAPPVPRPLLVLLVVAVAALAVACATESLADVRAVIELADFQ